MHYVAVTDDIIRALEPHAAGVLGALLAAASDEILVGDGFGPDKALFEIAMNDAGGLWRLGTASDGPGPRFFRTGRQKGDQIEERIADPDDAIEPGLAEP